MFSKHTLVKINRQIKLPAFIHNRVFSPKLGNFKNKSIIKNNSLLQRFYSPLLDQAAINKINKKSISLLDFTDTEKQKKSMRHVIETVAEKIDSIYNNNHQEKYDINAVEEIALSLSRTFDQVDGSWEEDETKPQAYSKYHVYVKFDRDAMSDGEIGCSFDFYIHFGLKAEEYYKDIFSKYIQLDLQIIRILIASKQYVKCQCFLRDFDLRIRSFYEKMIVSDKILFFDYIQEISYLINEMQQHINKEQNMSASLNTFDFDLLKLNNLPRYEKRKIYTIPALEQDLKKYINSQTEKLKATFFYLSPAAFKAREQIVIAKWLLENLPYPSAIDLLGYNNLPIVPRNYHAYEKALSPGPLYNILKQHYPLILIKDTQSMVQASIEWWLAQKNINEVSPFVGNSAVTMKTSIKELRHQTAIPHVQQIILPMWAILGGAIIGKVSSIFRPK